MTENDALRPDEHDDRIMTTHDIIHASHVVVRGGRRPARLVVRSLPRLDGPEYVVHTEYLDQAPPPHSGASCGFRHHAFDQGDYFRDMDKAVERFEERVGRL
jgi:hypothetical protein